MTKVILVGYMGSGKSIIGQLLSEKTGVLFLDLDQIIEAREKSSIKKIFETKGEIYFRKLEHLIFEELVQSSQNFILSTGGGTPCYANNHKMLSGAGIFSIYLAASVDTLCNRLYSQQEKRPLLLNKSENELKDFIAKHVFERNYYYNQTNYIIDTNNKTPDAIVNEINVLLQKSIFKE